MPEINIDAIHFVVIAADWNDIFPWNYSLLISLNKVGGDQDSKFLIEAQIDKPNQKLAWKF